MPASPVVCRCTRFRWKRPVDPSGSLSKTISGYREALLAMDAVIGKAEILGARGTEVSVRVITRTLSVGSHWYGD
jgi:hypothetical protein